MATPRKAAMTGFDAGGRMTAAAGQNARPERRTASNVSESAYVRKPVGLGPDNLPFKRQAESSQGELRSSN